MTEGMESVAYERDSDGFRLMQYGKSLSSTADIALRG